MENLKFNIRMHSLSFTHRFFIVIVATSTQKRILSIRVVVVLLKTKMEFMIVGVSLDLNANIVNKMTWCFE